MLTHPDTPPSVRCCSTCTCLHHPEQLTDDAPAPTTPLTPAPCAQAIKLQVNSGSSGCFPMHFDTDESLDGRKVTCIFYLNPG